MKKEVSVAAVAKRMNRILETYKEQKSQDDKSPEAPSTSKFGQMVYTTKRGLELHRTILNFAAQNDSGSDSDLSDQSYALIDESPPKRRRQPNRAVKRPAVKISAIATKRMHHRKVTCTSTSNSPSEQSNSPTETPTTPVSLDNTESDDSDAPKTIIITTSRRKIGNENRRSTKKISSDS